MVKVFAIGKREKTSREERERGRLNMASRLGTARARGEGEKSGDSEIVRDRREKVQWERWGRGQTLPLEKEEMSRMPVWTLKCTAGA